MVLKDCWEYEYKSDQALDGANEEAQKMGLSDIHVAPTVARSAVPPWLFPMPLLDIQLHKEKHNNETSVLESLVVQKYIDLTYYSTVQLYTDGSKDPDSGKTAVAVYIPLFKIKMSKRTSDHISVFTAELIAILLALLWKYKQQRQ